MLFWCRAKVSDIQPRLPPPPRVLLLLPLSLHITHTKARCLSGWSHHPSNQKDTVVLTCPWTFFTTLFYCFWYFKALVWYDFILPPRWHFLFLGTFSAKNADKWIWKSEFKWGQVYFVIRDEWPIGSSRGNSEFTAYVLSAALIQNVT